MGPRNMAEDHFLWRQLEHRLLALNFQLYGYVPYVLIQFSRSIIGHAAKLYVCFDIVFINFWPKKISLIFPPNGGRECPMSPPCLESQGCHLIPLCYLLSRSSAMLRLLPGSSSSLISTLPVHSPAFFPKPLPIFSCVGLQNKISHPVWCRFPCWVPAAYKWAQKTWLVEGWWLVKWITCR